VKVKKLINNGKKPIDKVTLKDGSTVKCSMNHRFRTTCGYTLSLAEIIDKKLSIATLDHFSHTHAQSAAEE
jgi:predicted DNA-binding antitoxin AbrB/MazE fold protein